VIIPDRTTVPTLLLPWYDADRRVLPWRALPGETPDPYRVWLSEIMLQQTTVAAVIPKFLAFARRWPAVFDLAAASLDDVLVEWAGLGYYARARNLHACARVVAERFGGRFPDTAEGLSELPGVGPYTAGAITAIAFDRKAVAVDGNVERVVARLFAVGDPMPGVKPELRRLAATLVPERRPGDFTQAMMDLGAMVCAPRGPRCELCPLAEICEGRRSGVASKLPRRAAKAERPTRRGVVFFVVDRAGRTLLRERPPRGLLGGMTEFPGTPWDEGGVSERTVAAHTPLTAAWETLGVVEHVFSHFRLELEVRRARVETIPAGTAGGYAHPTDRLGERALPGLMRKVALLALPPSTIKRSGSRR